MGAAHFWIPAISVVEFIRRDRLRAVLTFARRPAALIAVVKCWI
jgi:hypothetical protein